MWHSVSIGDDGPKYYVEFTDTEIKYGTWEEEAFDSSYVGSSSLMRSMT